LTQEPCQDFVRAAALSPVATDRSERDDGDGL
jgi:hypothetical protein